MTGGASTGGDRIVAVDVGTQSVRALLVGPDGTIHGSARVPIVPYVSPQPGWAEQDPEVHWSAVGEACRRLLVETGIAAEAIVALTLTTQRGTVVVTDDAGTALRPAIIWLDDRRTRGLPPFGGVGGLTALGFRALRLRDTIEGFAAACEANWLRSEEPQTWSAIRHYLLLSGFLTHRLTGRFVDSAAAQVGYLPYDYRRFRWASPGDWRWTVAPVDPAWLPELVPPTGRLGELTTTAAAATGLPVGLPVIAAAADKACEVLGSGAIRPEMRGHLVWDRRLGQHDDAPLRRGHPADPAVPVGRARGVVAGGPGLSRLLDGRVVQARVRRVGGRAGSRARCRPGVAVR